MDGLQAIPADLGTVDGVQHWPAIWPNGRTRSPHCSKRQRGVGAPFGEFPESGFDKVLDVNVKGVFLLTRALAPVRPMTTRRASSTPAASTGSFRRDGVGTTSPTARAKPQCTC